MSDTSDILSAYLREISSAKPDAGLEVDKLEDDYVSFAEGLMFFAHCFSRYNGQAASMILRIADERMYEQKRARKQARSDAAQHRQAYGY